MKILNIFALIGVIVSIATIGGIVIPATAQPTDNIQTQPVLKSLTEGNLTSNIDSNWSNVTTPAEYR
jgi:hypothetical protein